jgi:hypothetical protein
MFTSVSLWLILCLRQAAVIILETLDVVFPEVGSALNLNKDQLVASDIFDAVCRSNRNINRLAGTDADFASVQRHFGGPRHDHPMLGTLFVPLIAQAFLRQNFNAFDLVILGFIENRETAPGTFVVKHSPRIYFQDSTPQ